MPGPETELSTGEPSLIFLCDRPENRAGLPKKFLCSEDGGFLLVTTCERVFLCGLFFIALVSGSSSSSDGIDLVFTGLRDFTSLNWGWFLPARRFFSNRLIFCCCSSSSYLRDLARRIFSLRRLKTTFEIASFV